jgi:hypothetical protein
MIYRREWDFHSNPLAEIFEHCTVEVLCVVDRDVARDAISVDDILPEKYSNWYGGYIRELLRLYPFREVFDCHDGEV